MTELVSDMRHPDGEVIRSSVVFDKTTLRMQMQNRTPFIGPPSATAELNRVMRKEILWTPRPGRGLGRNERAAVMGDVPAFSVLNGIGNAGDTKHDFFKRYRYVGLATGTMQANALNTDADIYSAVDRQGLTRMQNNGPETIFANELVMIDIPSDAGEAERLSQSRAPPEGGTPERRHTAFPRRWDYSLVMGQIADDMSEYLRGGARRPQPMFPSVPELSESIRSLLVVGMILGWAYGPNGPNPVDATAMVAAIQGRAPGGELDAMITQLLLGDYDSHAAALLFPIENQFVFPGVRIDANTPLTTRQLNRIQKTAFVNMGRRWDALINEAGRDRVIGRAISTTKPDGDLSILLFG